MANLTIKKVARLIAQGKKGRYHDSEVKGLYLQVLSPDNCSGVLRYKLRGKERMIGLGSLADFTWPELRQRALKARQLKADGIDPLLASRTERAKQAAQDARNKTFAAVCSEYVGTQADGWSSPKHRQDFVSSLKRHVFPIIGSLPVGAIDEPLVLQVLQPIWTSRTVTASRLQRSLAAIFDFAIARKLIERNPAKWRGNLRHQLAAPSRLTKVEHHPAMAYSEVPEFISELRATPGILPKALQFLILTAARTGEVTGARWAEVDFAQRQWIVPAERMKGGREHRVPLSRQCVSLLQALPREANNDHIFLGGKRGTGLGEATLLNTVRKLRADGVTTHGFRSSFRDWAAEKTAFASIVSELSLAHTVGSEVERSYRRTDLWAKRQRLLQMWSDFVDTPTGVGTVTPLRART